MRLVIFAILAGQLHFASADTLTGRVVRVTDGDTIVILDSANVQYKIRLKGIDAPERGQPFGSRSRENLSRLVAGRFVTIDYDKKDRYGRIVGIVKVDDVDACLQQIDDGLAWHYKKYEKGQTAPDRVRYSSGEIEARENRRGLWVDPAPVPPWEWRHGKGKRSGRIAPGEKSGSPVCGSKSYCKEMLSCDEAKYYLVFCGRKGLDRDRDGTPCESLCK